MTFTPPRPSAASEQRGVLLLAGLLLLAVAVGYMRSPITRPDTDLWFHMSGGRHFVETGEIRDSSDFSFIEPERHFVNYYWLFQVVAYEAHALGGYTGVLVLRTLLNVALAGFLLLLLLPLESRPRPPSATDDLQRTWSRQALWGLAWVALVYFSMSTRLLNPRPHLFSYTAMIFFLYVLEKRPRWTWVLPLVGLVWMNMHGIVYPVMLTICGAYGANWLWDRWFTKDSGDRIDKDRGRLWPVWIVLTMATVLATPHFTELLATPFTVGRAGELYINELRPFRLMQYAVFNFTSPQALQSGAIFLVVVSIPLAVLLLAWTRRIRPSQVILLAAGLTLLSRYGRFYFEYALLGAPIVAAGLHAFCARRPAGSGLARLVAVGVLTVFFVFALTRPLAIRGAWPFSQTPFPVGTMDYLASLETPGKVMSNPSPGGYLHWRLGKKHKIFSDMQMSLFTEQDSFAAMRFFQDTTVTRRLLQRYEPDFILYPFIADHPEILEQFPRFVPVFLDNTSVLLVDSRRRPTLAAAHAIDALDPFAIKNAAFDSLPGNQAAQQYALVSRMLQIAPHEYLLNHIAGQLAVRLEDMEAATRHAAINLQYHPQSYSGDFIMGQIALSRQQWPAAVRRFERAGERARSQETRKTCQRNLYMAALKSGKYEKAYESYLATVRIYDPEAGYKDFFELGVSAAAAGKHDYAKVFLRFALLTTPQEDEAFRNRILQAFQKLGYVSPLQDAEEAQQALPATAE